MTTASMLTAKRGGLSLALGRRLATHLAALAGFLAMLPGGEMPLAVTAVFLAGTAFSLLKGDRQPQGLAPFLGVVTAGVLAVLLFFVAQGGLDIILGASIFSATVALNRLLGRRSAQDDPLLLLTTLLMLAAGAALTGEAFYGACFVVYGFSVTVALTFSHLERAVDQAGLTANARDALVTRSLWLWLSGLASLALAGAALFFLLFPRVNAQWLGRHRGAVQNPGIGFSDQISLGGFGALRDDPRPALRVRFPELDMDRLPERLRDGQDRLSVLWRGQTLDTFDGRNWTLSEQGGALRRPVPGSPMTPADLHARVEVLPTTGAHVVFSPGPVEAAALRQLENGRDIFRTTGIRWRVSGDAVVLPPPQGYFSYEVWTRRVDLARLHNAGRAYPAEVTARDLQLPAGLDPRIAPLARSWVEGSDDPVEQARRITERFRRGFTYSTTLENVAGDPVAHFLFERRAGHCEYFSTAMVLMLRTLGIPAHEVTGFMGGVRAPGADYFVVRAGDAHSWVEVFVPGTGYVPFDPTPDAVRAAAPSGWRATLAALVDEASEWWRSRVVDYDLRDQLQALSRAANALSSAADRFRRDGESPSSSRRAWPLLAALAGVTLVALGLRRLARRQRVREPQDEAARAYRGMLKTLQRSGLAKRADETPREFLRRVEQQAPARAVPARALTRLYEDARFAGHPWGAAERSQVKGLMDQLRRA